jgi:hypothetical protein
MSPAFLPAEKGSIVAQECWSVAEAQGPSAALARLRGALLRDPSLLTSRPILGAMRRLYGLRLSGWEATPVEHTNGVASVPSQQAPVEPPTPQGWIERLLRELPKLHHISEDQARWMTEHGWPSEAGPFSWAVPPQIIRYFAATVKPDDLTIETGAGHSTVALAALAKHHICITVDEYSVGAIQRYLDEVGIPREKVTFIVESSDTALPRMMLTEKLDFAYIDGQHGYPFAALDWHFIDRLMKVGGIVGFDNAEIPSVHNHCEFLDLNRTYRLVENISGRELGTYAAYFYTKLSDQSREAGHQLYNHRHMTGMYSQEEQIWPWG